MLYISYVHSIKENSVQRSTFSTPSSITLVLSPPVSFSLLFLFFAQFSFSTAPLLMPSPEEKETVLLRYLSGQPKASSFVALLCCCCVLTLNDLRPENSFRKTRPVPIFFTHISARIFLIKKIERENNFGSDGKREMVSPLSYNAVYPVHSACQLRYQTYQLTMLFRFECVWGKVNVRIDTPAGKKCVLRVCPVPLSNQPPNTARRRKHRQLIFSFFSHII